MTQQDPSVKSVFEQHRALPGNACNTRLENGPSQKVIKTFPVHHYIMYEDIHDLILDEGVDIAFITESWLSEKGDEAIIHGLTPSSHKAESFPRTVRSGGGICVVYSKALEQRLSFKNLSFRTVEAVEVTFNLQNVSMQLVCIYRPPYSKRNRITDSMFVKELPDILSDYQSKSTVFLGDLNVHFDDTNNSTTKKIKTCLHDFSLTQLVEESTHTLGHTLDILIVNDDNQSVSFVAVRDLALSDHWAIFFHLSVTKPKPTKRTITSRNLRRINPDTFREDVRSSLRNLHSAHFCPLTSSHVRHRRRYSCVYFAGRRRHGPCRFLHLGSA
jgi:hypothetical protein